MATVEYGGKTFEVDEDGFIGNYEDGKCDEWVQYVKQQEGIDELISRDADFENFELGKHHILPLPQFEVDNNTNLEQNPNY